MAEALEPFLPQEDLDAWERQPPRPTGPGYLYQGKEVDLNKELEDQPQGFLIDRDHPITKKLPKEYELFRLPTLDQPDEKGKLLFIRKKPQPPLVGSASSDTAIGGPQSDQLEGFVPPEEDKVTIDRRLGSIPHRAPEIREEINSWRDRFNYALSVMSGQQPASWVDQIGAREVVTEAGFEGAQYAIPSVKPFPRTVMRPGATIAPAGVVPFTRPFEGIVPKEKQVIPESANVNVDLKKGWNEVTYRNELEGKDEPHHFLRDDKGRPVALIAPGEHIPGLRQRDDPGWFINFLDPAASGKHDMNRFVGDTFMLDDLAKAKEFAGEAVQTGKFGSAGKIGEKSPMNDLYVKYLEAQAKRREGFVREVSPEGKIIDKNAAKDMETTIVDLKNMLKAAKDEETKMIAASKAEDAKRIADLNAEDAKVRGTGRFTKEGERINSEGMIENPAMEKGIDETWGKMVAADKAREAEFRAADAERRRGLFTKVEGGKGKEGPELVTAAVIETPDGKRLRGYSHFDAMTKNWDEYIKHDAEKMKGSLFETSTGRLIDKDEALKLMDKTGQKRLGLSTKETGLMSEDVPDLLKGENEKVMRELGIDPNAPHPYFDLPTINVDPDKPLKFTSGLDRKQTNQFFSFVTQLGQRVDPEKWRRFIEAQPLSENIEDRRNEPYLAKRGEQELYQDLLEESFRQLREQDILSMKPIPPLKREAEAR